MLMAQLRDEIDRGGPITFARFMEVALHDPHHGYYAAATARPGRAGDFLTAPETHPIFGRTLARALEETWRLLGGPGSTVPFTLVEHGAGSGALALAILDGLRRSGSPLLAQLRYEPVELAPNRRAELAERLRAAGFGEQLALEPGGAPFRGVVLANELLDALPVHRVALREGRLVELAVGWAEGAGDDVEGRFVEVGIEPTTAALAERLADEAIVLAEGQVAEICLALEPWVAAAAARLDRGLIVTIDYGHEAADLYGAARLGGTLRTYSRHMVAAEPYLRVGRQDITAHVDLTALRRAAERAGLVHLGTTSQAAFLIGSGLEGLLDEARHDPVTTLAEGIALRAALLRLLDPGATGAFAVAVFGRGLPPGTTLGGLAYRLPR